ncbi:hypothetical protein PGB90_002056 [Kerria lacca]
MRKLRLKGMWRWDVLFPVLGFPSFFFFGCSSGGFPDLPLHHKQNFLFQN